MRRAALAVAVLGLLGLGTGCRSTFGRCDCQNDPSCQPLPAYANPYTIAGPTTSGATVAAPVSATPMTPNAIEVPAAPK